MLFKPVANAPSDVPLRVPFAIGFANLSQTLPSAARRLTRCYVLLMLLASCTKQEQFPSWIEGRWESNLDLSIQANKANYENAPLAVKHTFDRVVGANVWVITEGSLNVISEIYDYDIAVHFVTDSSGLVLIESSSDPKAGARILKIDNDHFCTESWIEPLYDEAGQEVPMQICYSKVGT